MIILMTLNQSNSINIENLKMEIKLDRVDLENALSGLLAKKIIQKTGVEKKFDNQDIVSVNTTFDT